MFARMSLVLLALAALVGCARFGRFTVIRGSGNVITESRAVSGFTRVALAGIGNLNIQQGATESLSIEAEDNLMPLITTEVTDGTLIIGIDELKANGTPVPTKPIIYNLQMTKLDGIRLSGAGNVYGTALTSDSLDIATSGAGNMKLNELQASRITAALSGAGNVEVAGKTQSQEVLISGLGNYTAGDLQSNSATVTVSGAGSATVWTGDSLNVRITGAGSVSYYGSPQVTQTISGVGTVRKVGNK